MNSGSSNYDEGFYSPKNRVIAGVDEVGRGCLAGPVVVSCCLMPRDVWIPGINDSKKLTPSERVRIFEQFEKCPGCHYTLGIVEPVVIDEINILQATLLAMKQAVLSFKVKIDLVLIDGNTRPDLRVKMVCEPKLDERSKLVGMASIIAKVHRDQLMVKYHELYPEYGWDKNKGYGTPIHLKALKKHGPTPLHRKSFAPARLSLLDE